MAGPANTTKEPEADGSNINPNEPFSAEVENEIRSPLRASRTTISQGAEVAWSRQFKFCTQELVRSVCYNTKIHFARLNDHEIPELRDRR